MDWDNPDPKDYLSEDSVTVHMSNLVNETIILHKVLVKYLKRDVVKVGLARGRAESQDVGSSCLLCSYSRFHPPAPSHCCRS